MDAIGRRTLAEARRRQWEATMSSEQQATQTPSDILGNVVERLAVAASKEAPTRTIAPSQVDLPEDPLECGHTFCIQCLNMHYKNARKPTCPTCRVTIKSKATNFSAQSLAVALSDRKPAPVKLPRAGLPNPAENPTPDGYLKHLESLIFRQRIISSELSKEEEEIAKTQMYLRQKMAAQMTLSKELQSIENKIEELSELAALTQDHLQSMEISIDTRQTSLESSKAKASLLRTTSEPLQAEIEKTCLICESLGVCEEDIRKVLQ